MHCTVKPGKYCIYSPSVAAKLRSIRLRPLDGGNRKSSELPLAAKTTRGKIPGKNPAQKAQGKQRDGGDCAASGLWGQAERLQDIVVRLRSSGGQRIATGDLRKTGPSNQAASTGRQGNREYTSYVLGVVIVVRQMSRRRRKNANDNKIRTRRRVAEYAEFQRCGKEIIATCDSGAGDHSVDGEHDLDSDRKCRSADAVWARDRRNTSGRDSPGQSTEIGAKAFGADAIGERERERAFD